MPAKYHFEPERQDGAGLLNAIFGVFRENQKVGFLIIKDVCITEKQDSQMMYNRKHEPIELVSYNKRLEMDISLTFWPEIGFDESDLRPMQQLQNPNEQIQDIQ